jgi:hypothetical protein
MVRTIRTKNNSEIEFNTKKEGSWDSRFHLAKQQTYDPLQDTYCKKNKTK